MKANKLGDNGSQEQPRREIMQGDKRRQGNSGSQHQPRKKGNQEDRQEQTRREIGKGEQLGDKATVAAKSSPEGKSRRENSWETKQQRQPRADQKGNHEGRQGGSDFLTIRRFRKSGTQPLRSKNPIASSYLGNEEGRFWESACRETNEGRQMKRQGDK